MSRTKQQQAVINAALNPAIPMITVPAIAGSGKTHTLVELTKELKPTTGVYLAYNKSISLEAATKFKGTNIQCLTIHALAYRAVVKQYGLRVGFFNARDVIGAKNFSEQKKVLNIMEDFLLSAHTSTEAYSKHLVKPLSEALHGLIDTHLDMMATGAIKCSHSFYMKFYHILLSNGTIEPEEVDLLLLDEFGDITGLTLDIFRLYPAKKKVGVGDSMQNIYSFNKTLNGFKILTESHEIPLTQSFRVSAPIASKIEKFVKESLEDDSFIFTGTTTPMKCTEPTTAYISRTNSALVSTMMELMRSGTCFNLTRSIDVILELPLLLLGATYGSPIKSYKYKHLEALRKEWVRNTKTAPLLKYLKEHSDDAEVSSAVKAVLKYGEKLRELSTYVNNCPVVGNTVTLTTAHSSKGLEFDSVIIVEDLNKSTEKAIRVLHNGESKAPNIKNLLEEDVRLYYVACSRAMTSLNNARLLK